MVRRLRQWGVADVGTSIRRSYADDRHVPSGARQHDPETAEEQEGQEVKTAELEQALAVAILAAVVVCCRLWIGAGMTLRAEARQSARRHLRAAAIALLSGDTSGYRFMPTLPRKPGSTDLYGSTHRGA